MLFVCHPKLLHKHCFQFLLELKWTQEKLKTMLKQNFAVTNQEHYGMLWYFWSGQLYLWLILKETNVWIVMCTPIVTMAAADAGEATKELD